MSRVEILYAGFIPCQAVRLSDIFPSPVRGIADLLHEFPYIGGDARGFGWEYAKAPDRSRGSLEVVFERTPGGHAQIWQIPRAGTVKGFKSGRISGSSGRFCHSVKGQRSGSQWDPSPDRSVPAPIGEIRATMTRTADHGFDRYRIALQMVTRNTLTFGTGVLGADFTAYATVNLNYRQGSTELSHWTVEGRHDGFPSFELYVGPRAPTTRVYSFDIHDFDVSAADLMGDAEVGFTMNAQAPWPPVRDAVLRYGRRWGARRYP